MSATGRRYPLWTSSVEPAPGDLRLVQAFVNTREVEAQTDELETAEELARWLVRWRLIGRSESVSERDRRRAIELREGLRELLSANGGEEGDPTRLQALQRTLGTLPLRCTLVEGGSFELVAVGDGWPRAAARILTIVARSMGDGSWKRLKACRRDDCRWAFFDSSKNRSGRWCSMTGCGDLMKARSYRRRLRRRKKSA